MARTTKKTAGRPSRLDTKRAAIAQNREAVTACKNLVYGITNELSLDEDRMIKRVDAALKSEYGAVNGLVNLLASIAAWPAEPGDGSAVSANRKILEDKFNLDLLMLDDIKNFRGYHSFVTDSLEIMSAVEPQYEDYADYCQIFLEELGLKANRPTISAENWARAEVRAIERATEDLESMKAEVARHKALITAQH